MKKFLSIFAIVALALGFTACEEPTVDPQDKGKPMLSVDKTEILANGADKATFTAYVKGVEDAGVQIISLKNNAILSGNTFTTTEPKNISVAFGYEVSGNMGKMRGVRYNVKFSYPSESAGTQEESTTPNTITLEYTAMGRDFLVNGVTQNVLKAKCEEGTGAYEGFWSAVPLPGDAISDDACDLSALTIASATLSPTFDADVTSYTTSVSSASSTVTATAADSDATVVIRNGSTSVTSGSSASWSAGENLLTVTVINGVSTKVYTVVVTKS